MLNLCTFLPGNSHDYEMKSIRKGLEVSVLEFKVRVVLL